jgi:50S ribosomal subunit-associated GTPase HflX
VCVRACCVQNPLRVDLQLEQLDSAEIVNVHILNKPDEAEQKESADDAETFRQQPETVHVEVKFDCKEQVTTKVVVENKPDQVSSVQTLSPPSKRRSCSMLTRDHTVQIISQDQVSRSHEWVFEGTIRPGSSPLWRLVMI